MRKDSVPTRVPRKKENIPATQASANDHIGGTSKRRFDAVLGDAFESLDLVKTASADDPNCCCFRHARDKSSLPRAVER